MRSTRALLHWSLFAYILERRMSSGIAWLSTYVRRTARSADVFLSFLYFLVFFCFFDVFSCFLYFLVVSIFAIFVNTPMKTLLQRRILRAVKRIRWHFLWCWKPLTIFAKAPTVWKVSKYGVISGPYFLVFGVSNLDIWQNLQFVSESICSQIQQYLNVTNF